VSFSSQAETVLEEDNTEERCCFAIFFLWEKEFNAKKTHKEMLPVYGGKCLSRKAVQNWVDKF
jgi:hypothetical protein